VGDPFVNCIPSLGWSFQGLQRWWPCQSQHIRIASGHRTVWKRFYLDIGHDPAANESQFGLNFSWKSNLGSMAEAPTPVGSSLSLAGSPKALGSQHLVLACCVPCTYTRWMVPNVSCEKAWFQPDEPAPKLKWVAEFHIMLWIKGPVVYYSHLFRVVHKRGRRDRVTAKMTMNIIIILDDSRS
jgi:hypothetical protein